MSAKRENGLAASAERAPLRRVWGRGARVPANHWFSFSDHL